MISKRILLVCILLLPAALGYSRQAHVRGKVTKDDGQPLDSCLVKAINSSYATYTNARGEFSLEYNVDSSDSLTFYRFGYEPKNVAIGTEALWVVLKHQYNMLNAVVVEAAPGTGKVKQGTLGKRTSKVLGLCSWHKGCETAIFLPADPAKHGLLKEAFFYIAKAGIPNSPFRMHVYNLDTSQLPGRDLLDTMVILHANDGDEWVSVDVSSRHISIGKGVFISMEWLSGSGGNPYLVDMAEFKKVRWQFNTQVLGFAGKYTRRGSPHYSRSQVYKKWDRNDINERWHDNIGRPMIYATYTYLKK